MTAAEFVSPASVDRVLKQALDARFFRDVDVQLARLVAPEPTVLRLILACVSRAVRQGHPCLPLSVLAGSNIVDEESREVFFSFPDRETLLQAVRAAPCVQTVSVSGEGDHAVVGAAVLGAADGSPVVAGEESALSRPFVLELAGVSPSAAERARLYTLRMHLHERALAARLRQLLERPAASFDPAWVEARLDHYFPPEAGAGEVDWQREAVRRALGTRFSVISGGPGTGKTSTVVKLLCLLTEAAHQAGKPSPRLALMAPTGKAAARMTESIQGALGRLALPEDLARAVAARASTVHRALGVRPDSRTRFRHHRHAPLLADIVLVDEASMVDLALMRALVDALPDHAQLILLGDRHQLASVEAGSVLSELCSALSDFPGQSELPAQSEAAEPGARPTRAAVTELQKSYRFAGDSGIAALATALREGDVDGVEGILSAPPQDLRFVRTEAPPARIRELERAVVGGYRAALRSDEPGLALERAASFRILCAHRRGDFGVEQVNALCRSWLGRAGLVPGTGEHYRGRLLLVTENDYSLDLRNGDIGIVWPDPAVKDRVQLAAFFPTAEGRPRRLSLAQLPSCETAFAMTIHKSQGSEYGDVAVVLPPAHSPLLSRELLYTAVTRAKQRVLLFGPLESIAQATSARVLRHSGLAGKLSRPP